uniref:Fruit bromelain n=1 Tax=Ananas comosus var. bracteatus TaxID=296719 RepID=A0A6V7QH89_ANACO|nr:unnamed protein product [Ananas comosus var. bracteatus]
MAEYGRVYNDNDEKLHRFQIFKNNVNHIETFNSRSGNSYTLGVNKFADMTNSEFIAQYTRLSLPQNTKAGPIMSFEDVNMSAVPQSIDWREYVWLCGQLPTHSSKGTMVWHPKLCNPYQEYKATCNANYVPSSAYITGYGSLERNNETSVTYAVSNQPVAVSIHVSEDFRFYSGGVFRRPCSGSLNHAVVIIGYDQDSSSGIKYWTVKNSWGSWPDGLNSGCLVGLGWACLVQTAWKSGKRFLGSPSLHYPQPGGYWVRVLPPLRDPEASTRLSSSAFPILCRISSFNLDLLLHLVFQDALTTMVPPQVVLPPAAKALPADSTCHVSFSFITELLPFLFSYFTSKVAIFATFLCYYSTIYSSGLLQTRCPKPHSPLDYAAALSPSSPWILPCLTLLQCYFTFLLSLRFSLAVMVAP